MRFYFGFSKKIPIKWIVAAVLGLLAFFGLTQVHAATTQSFTGWGCGYSGSSTAYDTSYTYRECRWLDHNQSGYSTNYLNIDYGSFNGTITGHALLEYAENSQFPTGGFYLNNYRIFIGGSVSNNASLSKVVRNGNQAVDYYFQYTTNGTQSVILQIYPSTYNSFQSSLGYYPFSVRVSGSTTFEPSNDLTNQVYNSGVANIINSQSEIVNNIIQNNEILNQTNENISQTNDILNNDNVDESLNTGNDFFDDFEITDNRSISSIVTLPLNLLNRLLTYSNSSCSPLVFNLDMSDDNISRYNQLELPCGSILWSRVSSNVETLYSVLIYGLMGYRVALGLLKFFNITLNPEKDKEYYLEL